MLLRVSLSEVLNTARSLSPRRLASQESHTINSPQSNTAESKIFQQKAGGRKSHAPFFYKFYPVCALGHAGGRWCLRLAPASARGSGTLDPVPGRFLHPSKDGRPWAVSGGRTGCHGSYCSQQQQQWPPSCQLGRGQYRHRSPGGQR